VVVRDPKVVRKILGVFESDWADTDAGKRKRKDKKQAAKRRAPGGLQATA
jgi:hypothetical protein